jgi:hypothetical protein
MLAAQPQHQAFFDHARQRGSFLRGARLGASKQVVLQVECRLHAQTVQKSVLRGKAPCGTVRWGADVAYFEGMDAGAVAAGDADGGADGAGAGAGTDTPGPIGMSAVAVTLVTKWRVSPKQVVGRPTFSS